MYNHIRKMFREVDEAQSAQETGNSETWCEVEIQLRENRDGKMVLSICGSAGHTSTEEDAREEALNYWEGFFDEDSEARLNVIENHKKFMTTREMAQEVIDSDGEYHGLDVHKEEEGKVYLLTSCGQIRETIVKFFPEIEQYLWWHLNDMHADGSGNWSYLALPANVIAWAVTGDPTASLAGSVFEPAVESIPATQPAVQNTMGCSAPIAKSVVSSTEPAVCCRCGFVNVYMDPNPSYVCSGCRM